MAHTIVSESSDRSTLSPDNVAANIEFIERLGADPRVLRVDSIFGRQPRPTVGEFQMLFALEDFVGVGGGGLLEALDELVSDDRRTQMIRVVPRFDPTSDEARALVEEIRSRPPSGDMEVLVTGVTAYLEDTVENMYSDFPGMILYVFIVTYFALLVLFRSVFLPLKAVLLNVLSILASFGALVFVFQYGYLQGVLGFGAEVFLEATVPILVFSVVFGLSMDYEVFLLSRVKEEYDETGDNTHAVAVGTERSGRVITSAAAMLVLVSAGFATGDILIIKALGLGTAIAVLIDSTIVRALLVPALMCVLSRWNWWAPGWLGAGPPTQHRPKAL